MGVNGMLTRNTSMSDNGVGGSEIDSGSIDHVTLRICKSWIIII